MMIDLLSKRETLDEKSSMLNMLQNPTEDELEATAKQSISAMDT